MSKFNFCSKILVRIKYINAIKLTWMDKSQATSCGVRYHKVPHFMKEGNLRHLGDQEGKENALVMCWYEKKEERSKFALMFGRREK